MSDNVKIMTGLLIFAVVAILLLLIRLCWSSHKELQNARDDITALENQNRFLKEALENQNRFLKKALKNAEKSVSELCMLYINCRYKEKYTRCYFVPSADSSKYKLIMYKGTDGKTVACTYIINPVEHKIIKINEMNIIMEGD